MHKATTVIVREHDPVFIEDIHVSSMMKNHCLAKSPADTSISEFVRMIGYKCGREIKAFGKGECFFASSQRCTVCGGKNTAVKDPGVRGWTAQAAVFTTAET